MFGEKIAQGNGKITGTRVILNDRNETCVETSVQGTGSVMGVDITDLGTYAATMRPSGVLKGEGRGIWMTRDGESILWTGHGVGKPTGEGLSASWRYTLVLQTASSRLSRLNGIIACGEWETSADGTGKWTLTEWK